MAIAFLEAADHGGAQRKLQIFATDLHDAALEKARAGFYPKGALQDVSSERLRRFFVEEVDGYRVQKALREMCIFARQNFTGDPPFSRVDFISCRNVLIYLGNQLQEKAASIFHYALKPGGFLFLGASESIGPSTDFFEPIDKKHKIFVKRAVPTPIFRMHFAPAYLERSGDSSGKLTGAQQDLNILREVDRVVLDRFSPPCVLVDENLQILQFRGDTSAYLKPHAGRATLSLFKMTRQSLNQSLRALIRRCKAEEKPVRKERLTLRDADVQRELALEVVPINRLNERFHLILFQEQIVKDAAALRRSRTRTSASWNCSRIWRKCGRRLNFFSNDMRARMSRCRLSTKKSNPAMRSCRASTRSLRPQRKNSSRQMKS